MTVGSVTVGSVTVGSVTVGSVTAGSVAAMAADVTVAVEDDAVVPPHATSARQRKAGRYRMEAPYGCHLMVA